MRRVLGPLCLVVVLGGCGGGEPETTDEYGLTEASGSPTRVDLPAAHGGAARHGRQLVVSTGCLACHTVGTAGNDGPGSPLAQIGARMSAAGIRRVLVDAPAPMPSFRNLPAGDLAALAIYLSQLR